MGQPSNHMPYISGLKGLACMMIMLRHFMGVTGYDALFPQSYSLYLFFVVSGYLIAGSRIASWKQLAAKSFLRFIRLGLPVLFSCGVIYLIYLVFGFSNSATASLGTTPWYCSFYPTRFTVWDVIISPISVLIFGHTELNATYWMLRDMLVAAIVIYGLQYVRFRFPQLHVTAALIAAALSVLTHKTVVLSCLVGYGASAFVQLPDKPLKAFSDCSWLLLLALAGLQIVPKLPAALLVYAMLLVLVPSAPILNRLLCAKPIQFLAKISWSVYSYHWPIMCSIGGWMLLALCRHMAMLPAWIITSAVCAGCTIVLSWICSLTLDWLSAKLTKQLTNRLSF